jgi:pyruvate carboxylase
MRILVVEDHVGDSTETILDIVDAGHRVVRCQPVGGAVEPCAALAGSGECPLHEPVDVVVDVHTGDEFELRELGAICAARAGAAVVSVGHAAPVLRTIRTSRADLVETLAALEHGRDPGRRS